MIDFFQNYRHQTYPKGDDWLVLEHVNAYLDFFNTEYEVLSTYITRIEGDILKEKYEPNPNYIEFRNHFFYVMPEIFAYITRRSFLLSMFTWNSRLRTNQDLLNKYGSFAKLVTFLDNNSQDFMTYYSLAKQVEKYSCIVMDIFRKVTYFSSGVKSGKIMHYFDQINWDFRDEYYNAKDRMLSDTSDNETLMNNIGKEYRDNFKQVYDDFLLTCQRGMEQLSFLTDACDIFYEDLQLTIKIIATVNLTFYSAPEDEPILRKNAADNFSFLNMGDDMTIANNPDPSEPVQVNRQVSLNRSVKAISIAVPVTLDYKKFINKNSSNMSQLTSTVVLKIMQYMHIDDQFEAQKRILETQSIVID